MVSNVPDYRFPIFRNCGFPAQEYSINIIAIQYLKFFLKKLSKNVATCLTLTEIGSYKSADVVDKVKKYGDCLIVSDACINLGMLHTDRLLYLDDKEMSEFAYKLIEYALLREEVRRDSKKR